MSHEPDCPLSTLDSDVDTKDCVLCPIARAAYRSGREDAANDMKTEWDKPVWEYDNNVKLIDRLLAAARGEQTVVSVVSDNLRDFNATHVFTEYGTITLGGDGEQ